MIYICINTYYWSYCMHRWAIHNYLFFFFILPLTRLNYCCYVQQAMAVKNISQSTEKTDNAQTDKTEQVTFGMKQCLRFQIVIFFFTKKFKQ